MLLSRRSKDKTVRPAIPIEGEDARLLGPSGASQVLNMPPVPAAVVEWKQGRFAFETVNRPFRLAGLGTVADHSPLVRLLGDRIAAFIQSDATEQEMNWELRFTPRPPRGAQWTVRGTERTDPRWEPYLALAA